MYIRGFLPEIRDTVIQQVRLLPPEQRGSMSDARQAALAAGHSYRALRRENKPATPPMKTVVKPNISVLITPTIDVMRTYGLGWNNNYPNQPVRGYPKDRWRGASPAIHIRGNKDIKQLTCGRINLTTNENTQDWTNEKSKPRDTKNKTVRGCGVQTPNRYSPGLSIDGFHKW